MKKGICLVVGLFLCLSVLTGCDSNSSHSNAYALPPIPQAKTPVAFSADGEFLGYVLGSGDQPHHILIYNDEINYRFIISNGTGLIWYQGSTNVYSPDNTCKDGYVIQNRYADYIQGGNETLDVGVWPFDSERVTSDSSQVITGKDLKYRKEWSQVYIEYKMAVPFPDETCQNGYYILPDNITCRKPDTYPCTVNGQEATCVKMSWQCKPYTYFATTDAYKDYPFHKVVPFTMALPFKTPVAVPIEIKVVY
jgi:hypothetical protein